MLAGFWLFFESFLCSRGYIDIFKFDEDTEDAMQLLKLRGKKIWKYAVAVLIDFISNVRMGSSA